MLRTWWRKPFISICVASALVVCLLLFPHESSAKCDGGDCPPIVLENVVVVQELADFPAPTSGFIIPESGVLYKINGFVNVGTNRFLCTGSDINFVGANNIHDGIIYTGTSFNGFLTCPESINVSDLSFVSINGGQFLTVSGDNSENVIFRAVNVTGFSDLGEVDEIANFASLLSQWIAFDEGFEFTGTSNNSLFIQTSTFIASGNTGSIFGLDGSVFRTILFEGGRIETFEAGQVGIDGDASSANVSAQGSVSGVVFAGSGDHLSGITNTDLLWDFHANFGNGGTEDSVNRGAMTLSGNTDTTSGTWPVKVVGTWDTGDVSRFTFNSNGRLTYVGIPDVRIDGICRVSPSVTAGGNQNLVFYPAVDGSVLSPFGSKARMKTGDVQSVTIPFETTLSTNSYVEVFAENETGATAILVDSGSCILSGF